MFRVSFTVENAIVIDRVLAGLAERTSDLTPVWPLVVAAFQKVTKAAFDTEGASTGDKWKDLAPSTQADRKFKGFPPEHPILKRTGKLERALTIGEGAAVLTTATTLRYVVSNQETPYFKYHQSTQPRKSKLPRRAPVLLTADDATAIVRPIRLYITGRDPAAQMRAPIL